MRLHLPYDDAKINKDIVFFAAETQPKNRTIGYVS